MTTTNATQVLLDAARAIDRPLVIIERRGGCGFDLYTDADVDVLDVDPEHEDGAEIIERRPLDECPADSLGLAAYEAGGRSHDQI
jgi:hypothetical protein